MTLKIKLKILVGHVWWGGGFNHQKGLNMSIHSCHGGRLKLGIYHCIFVKIVVLLIGAKSTESFFFL